MRALLSLTLALIQGSALLIASGARAEEYPIGVIQAVTGLAAPFGAPAANGIKLAADEINSSGFLGDNKLKLILEDSGTEKAQSITLMNRMATRDKVLMIMGPTTSMEALTTGPLANELAIVQFSTAVAPSVVQAGPWAFKGSSSPDELISGISHYAADTLKVKKCFLVFNRDNDAMIGQKNTFRDIVKQKGVQIAGEEGLLSNASDFLGLATVIAGSGLDCFYFAGLPEQGANLIIQSKQAGLPAGVKLMGNVALAAPEFVKIGGKAVEGTIVAADVVPGGVNEEGVKFVDAYQKRYGAEPPVYAAIGYSMMKIAAQAIKNAGPNPTREKVRDALAKIKDAPSILGKGTFTMTEGRYPTYGSAILVVKDGKFATVQ